MSVSGWRSPSTSRLSCRACAIERLGLAVAALALVEHRQVVEAGERVGMALAQHLAAELQRLLVERLGLAVAALALVQPGQVVEAGERVGMALAQHLAAELQGLP